MSNVNNSGPMNLSLTNNQNKMDIDKITIGEAKELVSLLGNKLSSSGLNYPIGKYVIVRSRNEGINFGKLVQADETGCVLEEASRLWYHNPQKASWYEGVALNGLKDDSKISVPTCKYIVEDYSITLCESDAIENIKNFPPYES